MATLGIHQGQGIIIRRLLSTQGNDLCTDACISAAKSASPEQPLQRQATSYLVILQSCGLDSTWRKLQSVKW